MSDGLRIEAADLADPAHAGWVRSLVDGYASDPMGGGEPLPPRVLERLVPALRAHPTTRIWLAFEGDEAVGAAVCFLGFCTFEAGTLLNVHDLVVTPERRRCGIGRRLLEAVEREARALGCCRLTLEVREDNAAARSLYAQRGFGGMRLGDAEQTTLFLSKSLQTPVPSPL